MKRKKYCVCCKKELVIYFGGQKYCGACGVYTKSLRQKISDLKSQLREARIKLYGQESGNERIIWKKGKK